MKKPASSQPSSKQPSIKAGETATGLYMDTQEPVEVKTLDDIPLGHKIAMIDHKVDESVIKYGADIGRVVADIKKGGNALRTCTPNSSKNSCVRRTWSSRVARWRSRH